MGEPRWRSAVHCLTHRERNAESFRDPAERTGDHEPNAIGEHAMMAQDANASGGVLAGHRFCVTTRTPTMLMFDFALGSDGIAAPVSGLARLRRVRVTADSSLLQGYNVDAADCAGYLRACPTCPGIA